MGYYMIEHIEMVDKLPKIGVKNTGYCIKDDINNQVRLYLYEDNHYIDITTMEVCTWEDSNNGNS